MMFHCQYGDGKHKMSVVAASLSLKAVVIAGKPIVTHRLLVQRPTLCVQFSFCKAPSRLPCFLLHIRCAP